MLDLECIDQIVKSQIVQKKLCLASLAHLAFEKTNKQTNPKPQKAIMCRREILFPHARSFQLGAIEADEVHQNQ